MAAENDIVIKLVLDDEGAVRQVEQLETAATGRLTKAFDQAGNSGVAMATAIGSAVGNLAAAGISRFISLAAEIPGQLAEIASRGADVGDVREAFERLTESAGGVASTLQQQLRQATGNTIADFDLLRQANENLRAGIKPDEIIELTKAARALAEETGQDLTQSIDEVTAAFETGRVAALRNRLGLHKNRRQSSCAEVTPIRGVRTI